MSDIAPRIEVGILNFQIVSGPVSGKNLIDLTGRFADGLNVTKLSIEESGVLAESGILLSCKDEIAIVAGAFPLTLAVRGLEFGSWVFDPEYPWDDYERSDI
jgi:hypothetical protein